MTNMARAQQWLRKLFEIKWKRKGCDPNLTLSPALFTSHIKEGLKMHPVCAHGCHYNEITGFLQRKQYNWHERKPDY